MMDGQQTDGQTDRRMGGISISPVPGLRRSGRYKLCGRVLNGYLHNGECLHILCGRVLTASCTLVSVLTYIVVEF